MAIVTLTSIFQQFTRFDLQHVLTLNLDESAKIVSVACTNEPSNILGRITKADYDDTIAATVALLEDALKRIDNASELHSALANVVLALNITSTTKAWCKEQS